MAKTQPQNRMKLLFGLWLLVAVFLILSRLLPRVPDLGVWLGACALSLPIARLLFWRSSVRRRALLDLYVNPQSPWNRRLQAGKFMLLMRAALAYALSLLFLIGLARVDQTTFWLLLVILVPIWVFSFDWFCSYAEMHVNVQFRSVVATRLHGAAHACVLILFLSVWGLYQPVPNLTGISFLEAVSRSAAAPEMKSDTLYAGLAFTEAISAVPIWIAQNWGAQLPGAIWKLALWLLVLLREWLFVWPLILTFQALHLFVDSGITHRLKETKSDGA